MGSMQLLNMVFNLDICNSILSLPNICLLVGDISFGG